MHAIELDHYESTSARFYFFIYNHKHIGLLIVRQIWKYNAVFKHRVEAAS